MKGKIEEIVASIKEGKNRNFNYREVILYPTEVFERIGTPEDERFGFKVIKFGMPEYNELKALKIGDNPMEKMIKELSKVGKTISDLYIKDESGALTKEVNPEVFAEITSNIEKDIAYAKELGKKQEGILNRFISHVVFPEGEYPYKKISSHLDFSYKVWLYNKLMSEYELTYEEGENLR